MNLDALSLAGCQVALFGLGILGNKLREIGAELIGFTSIEGYDFAQSLGVEEGRGWHWMKITRPR